MYSNILQLVLHYIFEDWWTTLNKNDKFFTVIIGEIQTWCFYVLDIRVQNKVKTLN